MTFIIGQKVRLRPDADLDGAEMDHLPTGAIGFVESIGWMEDDDVMVVFDGHDDQVNQCDPAWLEPTAACETDPALQDPFIVCPACGAVPGGECRGLDG